MTIAYLALAHDNPEQLDRLIRRLPGESPVYIHVDARAADEVVDTAKRLLANRPRTHFVRRYRCYWGSFGIVRATLQMISDLLQSGEPFERAMLISGTHYPIATNAQIADLLAARPDAEFIESFSLLEPNRWDDHERLYSVPDRATRRHLRIHSRVQRIGGHRELPDGMTPFGGSQWWCLTRECLAHIDRYVADHPRYRRFGRLVFIPDEIFFHTIISNSPFGRHVAMDDLVYAIWNRPEPPFPAILRMGDLDGLLASPKPFARKFVASVDAAVMDAIDAHLDGTGTAAIAPI
jgi:hypothetical protein